MSGEAAAVRLRHEAPPWRWVCPPLVMLTMLLVQGLVATAQATPRAYVPQHASAASVAASSAAPASPCGVAAPVASAVPLRLPALRYECMRMKPGHHVWVGQAGPAQGEVVLLVHGLGDLAHRDWRNVVPRLAHHYRVIALDLPGFGASPMQASGDTFAGYSATLAELLDRLAPAQRVHVVGHSLGGAVSLHFAAQQPERLRHLVLVDAAGMLHKSVFVQHVARLGLPDERDSPVARVVSTLGGRINALGRHMLVKLDGGVDFSGWLAQNPTVRNSLFASGGQAQAALSLAEHDFTEAMRTLPVPVTLIWGSADRVAPLRTGEVLAARLADARLRVIDGAGHVPMNERPEAFGPLLLDALRTPLAAPAHWPPLESGTPQEPPEAAPRSATCRNEPHRQFSGAFDHLTLENCQQARISQAQLKKLTLINSSVTLERVRIEGGEVALDARRSQVFATVADISGEVALRADNSQLDLAGVHITARHAAVEMATPSRIYFSLSEVQSPEHTGAAHFIWPVTKARKPKVR